MKNFYVLTGKDEDNFISAMEEKLLKELKKQVKAIKERKELLEKKLPDKNNMNASDLKFINGEAEKLILDHQNLIKEYELYKAEKEKAK